VQAVAPVVDEREVGLVVAHPISLPP
jgi:hypothetical protein